MNETPGSLLATDEPPPFTVHNENGKSPLLIVADHAGKHFPRRLGQLGLSKAECECHIAWDIGVGAVCCLIGKALNAVVVRQNYSRLVILAALSALFVQVLKLCERAGLVKLGHAALDGTKIKASASKHKAMSYQRMGQREAELHLSARSHRDAGDRRIERGHVRGCRGPRHIWASPPRFCVVAQGWHAAVWVANRYHGGPRKGGSDLCCAGPEPAWRVGDPRWQPVCAIRRAFRGLWPISRVCRQHFSF
jgi:hypothetical protein